MESKMIWQNVISGAVGGIAAGIFMLAVILLGYWLDGRKKKR